jgi:AcrR family transcriptional regulator
VISTRDRLIEAATRLLDEGGPAAVTLREVGRLAGVSHNAPYKHFAGKEDLLAAVAARQLGGPRPAGRAPAGQPDARQLMHAYVRWAMRYPARFKLTFGTWSPGPEPAAPPSAGERGTTGPGVAELAAAATAARAALVAAVERGQAARHLPDGDPERLAALILAVAHGAVDLALNGHLSPAGKGRARPQDLVDDLFENLRPRQ